MAHEMIVALEVTDREKYQDYREAMTPILKKYDGGFRYDFWIDEVLKNESGKKINRVFAIYCKDKESMDDFFGHPDYLIAKKKYFESSVGDITIISEYDR